MHKFKVEQIPSEKVMKIRLKYYCIQVMGRDGYGDIRRAVHASFF